MQLLTAPCAIAHSGARKCIWCNSFFFASIKFMSAFLWETITVTSESITVPRNWSENRERRDPEPGVMLRWGADTWNSSMCFTITSVLSVGGSLVSESAGVWVNALDRWWRLNVWGAPAYRKVAERSLYHVLSTERASKRTMSEVNTSRLNYKASLKRRRGTSSSHADFGCKRFLTLINCQML